MPAQYVGSLGTPTDPFGPAPYVTVRAVPPPALVLTLNHISCSDVDADTTRTQQPKLWIVPVPGRQVARVWWVGRGGSPPTWLP